MPAAGIYLFIYPPILILLYLCGGQSYAVLRAYVSNKIIGVLKTTKKRCLRVFASIVTVTESYKKPSPSFYSCHRNAKEIKLEFVRDELAA